MKSHIALRRRWSAAIVVTTVCLGIPLPARGQQYTAIDLYTLSAPSGLTDFGFGSLSSGVRPRFPSEIDNGRVAGQGLIGTNLHAFSWNAAGTPLDLNPTNLAGFSGSSAWGTYGTQQVGYGVSQTL